MKQLFLVCCLCFAVLVQAQSPKLPSGAEPQQVFPSLQMPDAEYSQELILNTVLPEIGYAFLKPEQFLRSHFTESPEGYHYFFTFRINEVESYDRFVKVFIDRQGSVRSLTYLLSGCEKPAAGTFINGEVLRMAHPDWQIQGEAVYTWYYTGNEWIPLTGLTVIPDIAANTERRYFDAQQKLVLRQPLAFRFHSKDTTLRGKVFWPDPLTSAQVPYGGAYQDFNDADTPSLNNERVWKTLRVRFNSDSFLLEDSTFYFVEIEAPSSTPPVLFDTVADFMRNAQEFEYINSYYHLQTWVRQVHDLGFDLPRVRIQVDPHASNGADVSGFSTSFNPPALLFGEGGIDDAEDADVLIHELGHGLSYGASPGTVKGVERQSIEEGNSDYFAMSYSRQISSYGWEKTFNWDGNLTWQGRVVNTQKKLPEDFSSNFYSNAEIWVAALARVYDSLGPYTTDRLVLCALYHQVPEMTFTQMSASCMLCDSLQNGAENVAIIADAFNAKGIETAVRKPAQGQTGWKLINTYGFSKRGEALTLDFGLIFSGQVELVDLQGRVLRSYRLDSAESFSMKPEGIKNGLYLLRVNSDTNHSKSFLISVAQ